MKSENNVSKFELWQSAEWIPTNEQSKSSSIEIAELN